MHACAPLLTCVISDKLLMQDVLALAGLMLPIMLVGALQSVQLGPLS